MSSFEINKILAAFLISVIIIFIINYVGNSIVKVKKNDDKEVAYKIEIPENNLSKTTSLEVSGENVEPISALFVTASMENGEKLFKKCGTCHNYQVNSKSKIGPNLWDIINRPKGSISGFAYSSALAEFGGVWTYEELGHFLYKPKQFISGTKMNFAGLKKAQDRADLILWLRQHSDNPIPLPE